MNCCKILLLLLFFLFIESSCKDHEIVTEKLCQFRGIVSHSVGKYYQTSTIEDYESDLSRHDDGSLNKYISTYKRVYIDLSNGEEMSSTLQTHQYSYVYNEEGYLTDFTHTITDLNKGSDRTTFSYENYPFYKEGSIKAIETTKYKYSDGLLSSKVKHMDITFSSEKTSPITSTTQNQQTFTYKKEANGNIAKMIIENQDGSKETSNFINGNLASKITVNRDGVIGSTSLFDEDGKILSLTSSDTETYYKYDTRGNLLRTEFFYKKDLVSLYEFAYDNNPNPELINKTTFKGILEPFQILYTNEGINNLTNKKLTHFQNKLTHENKFTYTLNSKGYPVTSTNTSDSNESMFVAKVAYKYQDCE